MLKKLGKKSYAIISLCLTVVLVLSICACGGNKEKVDNSSKNNSDNISSIADDNPEKTGESGETDNSNTANSSDNSYYSDKTDSSDKTNNSDKTDSSDKTDNSDNSDSSDQIDEESYVAPIAAVGSAVTGNKRTITVDTGKALWEDYMSIGSNLFVEAMSPYFQDKYGFNQSYFELQKKQIQSLNITTGRLIFGVATMVTNTEENPQRSDWQNNKDYINYKNGIYDFENDDMQSLYKYLEMYKEVGTEIYINFGFNDGDRIAKWFKQPLQSGTVRDLDLFAKAAAALLNELINNRGFTNVTGIAFYNEPTEWTDSFNTLGSKPLYYSYMIEKTYNCLKKYNLQNKVKFRGPEHTTVDYDMVTSWVDLFKNRLGSIFANITHHTYYSPAANVDYNYYFDFYTKLYAHTGLRTLAGEYLNSWYDEKAIAMDKKNRWNYSDASQLIANANTGGLGLVNWEGIGGCEPNIPYYGGGGYISVFPTSKETAQQIGVFYNGCALINNYVGAHADTLKVSWTGDDIRTSAFRREDGEYTVIVESNYADADRELTVNFGKNLGKKVYKYTFTYPDGNNPQKGTTVSDSIIPQSVGSFNNVGSKFTDTLSKDYCVYVYTTAAPKKQVKFEKTWYDCGKNTAQQLSASKLDCSASDQIVWSVLSSTGNNKGSISSNGLYTPASDAKAGDLIAVKAALKGNPKVYSVALVNITN